MPQLRPIPEAIPAATRDTLAQLSRDGLPDEAVAVVFIDAGGEYHTRPIQNRHPQPGSAFRVDPIEFAQVEVQERGCGRRLFALFHSHPRGMPLPSDEDLAHAWSGLETWIGAIAADGSFALARFAPMTGL